jgi:hypothetical protein
MASNVTVAYLADVTDLRTKSALAKATLSDVNSSIREQAAAFSDLSAEAKGPALAALQSLTAQQKQLQAEISRASAELKKQRAEAERGDGAFSKLHESIKLTGEGFEHLSASIGVWTGAASAIGEFAAAGLGLERGLEAVNQYAESAESMLKLSDATGLTTKQLYGLQYVANMTSTPFETVQSDLTKLARAMEEAAANADSGPGRAFKAMAISVEDANGKLRPMGDIVDALAAKFASYASGTDKTALELQLFGRTGSDLNALLKELGEQGLAAAGDKAAALGLVLGGQASEDAKKYEENIHLLTGAWQGFVNEVMGAVVPALNAVGRAMNIGTTLDEQIGYVKQQISDVQSMGATQDVGSQFINHFLGPIAGYMANKARNNLSALQTQLAALEAQKAQLEKDESDRNAKTGTPGAPGSQQAPAFSDKGSTQVEQWKTQLLQMETAEGQFHALSAAQEAKFWQDKLALTKAGTAEQREVMQEFVSASERAQRQGTASAKKSLEEQWHDFSATMQEQIKAAQGNFSEQTKLATEWVAEGKRLFGQHTADYREASDELLSIARQQSTEQLEIERQNVEAAKQLAEIASRATPGEFKVGLDLVLNPSHLTEQVQSQIRAATDGAQSELQLLANEMQQALSENNQPGYNQAFNQSLIVQAQLAQQVADINAKAAAATQASWAKIGQPIENAFGTIVGAAISGGRNAGQAMERAAVSVVESWAKSAVDMAAHWAFTQLFMTASSTSGAAARTAAGMTEETGLFARLAAMLGLHTATEASKTAATTTGATARVSADAASAAAGQAAQAASNALTIQADAAVAAAGAYAATAAIPFIGPELAPGAAAAAYGAVSSFQVAAAEGGWDNVPYDDYPTLLHKNEMVLPRNLADGVRNMASGGLRGPSMASSASFGNPSTVHNTGGSFSAALHQTNNFQGGDTSAMRAQISRAGRDAHQQMVDYYGNTGVATLPGRSVRK